MNVLKKLTGYKQSLDKPELRPKAVLLDVNGTIFAATAAAHAFKELGLDEGLVEVNQQTNCFHDREPFNVLRGFATSRATGLCKNKAINSRGDRTHCS
jgi:hypothetical protein